MARPQNFVMGNDEAELERSLQAMEKNILLFGDCSWLQRWNHRHSWERISKTIVIPLCILQISLKQMFDISAKLVTEQDEISGLETIGWEKHSWKYLSSIGDERIINLQRCN